jgi:hypothetical protein
MPLAVRARGVAQHIVATPTSCVTRSASPRVESAPGRTLARRCWATLGVTVDRFTSILQTHLPVVDDDQAPTSRPAARRCVMVPHRSTTCIAVKRQNIAKWPPRRHGGDLAKDRGFADADHKLRHRCPSGQATNEVAAGL